MSMEDEIIEVATAPYTAPRKKQRLSKGSKKSIKSAPRLLYDPNLIIHECNRYAFKEFERRFKCIYSVPQSQTIEDISEIYLNAMVLDNKICLLVLPFAIEASHFQFLDSYIDVPVSGKMKKGAKSIDAGKEIATLTHFITKKIISIKSPIAGRILEINDRYVNNTSLLSLSDNIVKELTTTVYLGDGYIAVVSSEAPNALKNHAEGSVEAFTQLNENVCFAWLKGQCSRGNDCRFEHNR